MLQPAGFDTIGGFRVGSATPSHPRVEAVPSTGSQFRLFEFGFAKRFELAQKSLVGEAPNIVARATTCAFPFSNTGWKGNLICWAAHFCFDF